MDGNNAYTGEPSEETVATRAKSHTGHPRAGESKGRGDIYNARWSVKT